MQFLDRTLPGIAENLALEDALLQEAEASEDGQEILRLWDANEPFIVIGRSSRIADEVCLDAVAAKKIPVLRRISGGAAVLAAPGCLFYAVLLSLRNRPHLRMIDEAHRFVMHKIATAIRQLGIDANVAAPCDLVVGNRKVGGNSLRVQREWLLYHGTLLLSMDLTLVDQFLRHPPREPAYRQGRSHRDFLANINVERAAVAQSLCRVWQATPGDPSLPYARTANLVQLRYGNQQWTYQR